MNRELEIGGGRIALYGDPAAPLWFLQMVDDHDAGLMESEAEEIAGLAGGTGWCLAAVQVEDWNRDLTPWPAPPAFGKEPFGDGAGETLRFLEEVLIPEVETRFPAEGRRFCACGYSLAGLFALWAVHESGAFAGCAAVSPSVWYPGWLEHAAAKGCRAQQVYLSLGDKEEKTRNPVMRTVGDAIREQYRLLQEAGVSCVLEWNPGNHFRDSDKRTARGIAWLAERCGL